MKLDVEILNKMATNVTKDEFIQIFGYEGTNCCVHLLGGTSIQESEFCDGTCSEANCIKNYLDTYKPFKFKELDYNCLNVDDAIFLKKKHGNKIALLNYNNKYELVQKDNEIVLLTISANNYSDKIHNDMKFKAYAVEQVEFKDCIKMLSSVPGIYVARCYYGSHLYYYIVGTQATGLEDSNPALIDEFGRSLTLNEILNGKWSILSPLRHKEELE